MHIVVEQLASGFGSNSIYRLLETLVAPEMMSLELQERDILLHGKQCPLIEEKTHLCPPTTNIFKNSIIFFF